MGGAAGRGVGGGRETTRARVRVQCSRPQFVVTCWPRKDWSVVDGTYVTFIPPNRTLLVIVVIVFSRSESRW